MDEYIGRKATIESLSAEALERNLDSVMTDDAHRYHRAAERVIAGVPAADVRPVVLCRDCIYAPTGNQDGADLEWPCDDFPERNPCPLKCEDRWYSRKPAPDFFCANGEKLNT